MGGLDARALGKQKEAERRAEVQEEKFQQDDVDRIDEEGQVEAFLKVLKASVKAGNPEAAPREIGDYVQNIDDKLTAIISKETDQNGGWFSKIKLMQHLTRSNTVNIYAEHSIRDKNGHISKMPHFILFDEFLKKQQVEGSPPKAEKGDAIDGGVAVGKEKANIIHETKEKINVQDLLAEQMRKLPELYGAIARLSKAVDGFPADKMRRILDDTQKTFYELGRSDDPADRLRTMQGAASQYPDVEATMGEISRTMQDAVSRGQITRQQLQEEFMQFVDVYMTYLDMLKQLPQSEKP